MRRSRMAGTFALLVALVLGSCDDGGDGAATTTSSSSDGTTTTTEAPAKAAIVLQPDGLGVSQFGEQKASVVAALTQALGAPDDAGTGCELAGTDVTTTSWEELTVQFADGEFDSYSVRVNESEEAVLELETEAGIGIGSTVAQLRAAYGDQIAIPGLPPEFAEPNSFEISFPGSERSILGLLTGTSDDAEITSFVTQLCE